MPVLERKRFDLTKGKRELMEAMLRQRGFQPTNLTIPRRTGGAAPLSFAQQRLWFLDQLEGPSGLYNIPAAFRIRGPLDVKALETALAQVVRRHETLRASFQTVNGEARQTFADGAPPPLELVCVSDAPEQDRERLVRDAAQSVAGEPFDLTSGRLVRAKAFRIGEQDHVVVLSLHHIAADGWSMKVLAKELGALVSGQNLPQLPVTYSDFAAWQREYLQGQTLESHAQYWRTELLHAPQVLELPTDLPRPPKSSHNGARFGFRIPNAILELLEALATTESATLFMVLMASWQTLLFRYTGQTDIVVGTPVANRLRPELENLIGFFVNLLPIRAQIAISGSFRDMLRQVRAKTVRAYEHQELPFEKLVDELRLPRNENQTLLFQTVLVLQNASEGLSAAAGREVEIFYVDTGISKFDLTLDISREMDGASAFLEYRTDLFSEAAIARLGRHWLTLLESIIANPDEAVCHLPFLSDTEWRFLTHPSVVPAVKVLDATSIQRQFQIQARCTPGRVAVTFESRNLTYAELNHRANAVAQKLRALGAGREVRVALCMERCAEMVVAILGILKAGAAYLPIDPACPPERITYIASDARAPILLTTKDRPEAAAAGPWQTLFMEDIGEARDEDVCVDVEPHNAAYVIYTSGSTGKPKGVVVDQANVLRLFAATHRWFEFGEEDVWTLFHSYAFDFSVWELWGALLYGGRLVVVPYWVSRSPQSFYRLLCDEGVTVLNQTPSAFRQLIQAEEQTPDGGSGLKLRYVIFGGEALELQSLRGWYARHPQSPKLINMYGITETTVHVTYRELAPRDLDRSANSVIGGPIPDLQVYLLDPCMQPVPLGVTGEIYVGGEGVARGYHDRPELTATRFVPDPFSGLPGARLYRSGDLARRLPDGDLDYLGRIDHQVKIRGFRIETGEIEAVLNQHPAICQSAVVARSDQPGEPRLTAYVVCRTSPPPSQTGLREHLRKQLPDYMNPAAIVFLDALPLTTNGKVDRRALPAPEAIAPVGSSEYAEPQTETERTLAEIWAQVLHVSRVGLHDNFFELGGDSILSIQAVARANQAGIRITPKQLFQAQTVKELAEIASARTGAVRDAWRAVAGPVPLSPIQSWYFEQNVPNPHHWNQAVLLELRQRCSSDLLEQAFQKVIAQHPSFHLRFHQDDGEWRQTYDGDSKGAAVFERHDLSHLPPSERDTVFERLAAGIHEGFNITTGPLIRAAYFEFGAVESARMLIIAHHLVVDGVSWRILVEELEISCSQIESGQMPALPGPTSPFPAWSRQLARYAQSDAMKQEERFWTNTVMQMPERPFRVPADRNLECLQHTKLTELNEELTRALLQDVPRAYRTRINDALLAALALAFTRALGVPRLAVDLEGHGREALFEEFDVSRSVGWFTSIYPVCLAAQPGVDDTLKAAKETLRAIPNNGIGFGIARYLSNSLPGVSDPAVSFNYLGQFDRVAEGGSLFRLLPGEWGPAHDPSALRRHQLDITAYVARERLHVQWTYAPGLDADVEALAAAYIEALKDIIAHCGSAEAGGYTPSDFPQAKTNQKDLDKLLRKLKHRR